MHAKRTIDPSAVLNLQIVRVAIVTSFAEVSRSEAMEQSHRATVVALPVDLLCSMLLAFSLTSAIGFQLAVFASKVLFLGAFFHVLLLLTVYHSAKVGLLAVEALEESA